MSQNQLSVTEAAKLLITLRTALADGGFDESMCEQIARSCASEMFRSAVAGTGRVWTA